MSVANGGTGSTTAANARSALGITPANIGAAASSHAHTLSQISDWPGIETTLSGETNKLVTSQAIQWAIPKLVDSDYIEWNYAQGANGQYEYWPKSVVADSLSGITPIQIKKFWQNPYPYNTFADPTYSYDFSDYSLVMVLAQYADSTQTKDHMDNTSTVVSIVPLNRWGFLAMPWGDTGTIASRQFYVTESSIEFQKCERSGSYVTDYMIPTEIYGIRGVTT